MNRLINNHNDFRMHVLILKRYNLHRLTLNGSLSVLNAMPGTYFSQTGKPLYHI